MKIDRIDRCKKPQECPSPGSETRCGKETFCSLCGIELKSRISEHRKRPSFFDLFQESGVWGTHGDSMIQCLSNTGTSPLEDEYDTESEDHFVDCLVPNTSIEVFERGPFWLSNTAQDMTEFMHGNETQWLRKKYKIELQILIKTFGQDNVRTRWGFLSWWS